MARPSTFSQQIAEKILDRISEGEMLIKICQEEEMPPRKTVYTWMTANPTFKEAYARARLAWADWWAERVLAISLDSSGDIFIDEAGKAVIDHANVQRARLQSDNIKWIVGKYAPRTYGDKVELPANDAGPLVISWESGPPPPPPAPPKLIEFDSGPLPKHLDVEVLTRMVGLIKARVPRAADRDPQEVLSEVMGVIDRALIAEYGE